MREAQITDTILMVRPANFGYNPETAQNNAFQDGSTDLTLREISLRATEEFDVMVAGLRSHGVRVIVVEDTESPRKTDAVFPNNWFSTHAAGQVYIYPMYSPNRRLERRPEIIDQVRQLGYMEVCQDLLAYEEEGQFLEGTGSMILDRPNKLIYACYSERTDELLLQDFADRLGYRPVGFAAVDDEGTPYYHTNVIMALGQKIAILCTESIMNPSEQKSVIDQLSMTGKELIDITREQVLSFAGNMLEVRGRSSKPLMVMSSSAYNSLTDSQINSMTQYNIIFHTPLATIEKFGGGSARCMMAEIFRTTPYE